MALKALVMKFANDRCLECSIWAIFLSSSSTDSTRALLRSIILSATDNSEFLMLFLTLVTSWIPFMNRNSNSYLPIYPLSPQSLPLMFSINDSEYSGSRSSTLPGVNIKFRISPLSLMIRCSLKPKNHPIEHLPRWAIPLKVLWISMRWCLQTLNGVESTYAMPVQVPGNTSFMNTVSDSSTDFCNSTNLLYHTALGNRWRRCLQTYWV